MTGKRPERGVGKESGWEAAATWFKEYAAKSTVGVRVVERWARDLAPGAAVLDVGCGPGSPRSEPLDRRAGALYAIDSAPTLAAAYEDRFPTAQVACEAVEESTFFGLRFDGILAWGVLFLLPVDRQREVLGRLVAALKPEGRLLFTAPEQECSWSDQTTGQTSWSLGREAYTALISSLDAVLESEFEDEGQNHYYSIRRRS